MPAADGNTHKRKRRIYCSGKSLPERNELNWIFTAAAHASPPQPRANQTKLKESAQQIDIILKIFKE